MACVWLAHHSAPRDNTILKIGFCPGTPSQK
jgi:hypothetical protein